MNPESINKRNNLWLRWVLANAAGLALGLALWGILSDTLGEHSPITNPLVTISLSIVAFLSVGAVAGTLQWLALRPSLVLSKRTIIVGSAGYAIGFITGFVLGGPPVDFLLGFVLFTLGMGTVQAVAMRRQVGRGGWWVPPSALGMVVGGIAGMAMINPIAEALESTLGSESLLAFAIVLTLFGIIAGAIGGAISGAVLARLLRRSAPGLGVAARPSPPTVS